MSNTVNENNESNQVQSSFENRLDILFGLTRDLPLLNCERDIYNYLTSFLTKNFSNICTIEFYIQNNNTNALVKINPTSQNEIQTKPPSLINRCYIEGKVFYLDNCTSDNGVILNDPCIKSLAALPLKSNGKAIGVLRINSSIIKSFSQTDLKIFSIISSCAGAAISNFLLKKEFSDEEKLTTTEEDYQSLFSSLSDMIVIMVDENFVEANKALIEFSGYSLEEIKQGRLLNIVSESSLPFVKERIKERKIGIIREYEIDIITKKNEKKTVLVKPAFIKYKNQKAVLVTFKDLTEKRKLEEQISYEKDLLLNLINSIPDLVYFKDLDSRFTKINDAQAKMLGIDSADKAIGKTDYDFFPQANEFFKDEQQIIKTGIPIKDKVEYVKNGDGNFVCVSTTKIPLRDKSNNIVGTAGISRDITDRIRNEEKIKKSEFQFRAIWENAFGAMRLINERGIILLVNKAFCTITGLKKEELIGKHYLTGYSENYQATAKQRVFNVFKSQSESKLVEDEVEFRNSNKRWFEISNVYLYLNEPMLLSIYHDISERMEAEAKLVYRTEMEMFVTTVSTSFIHYSPDEIFEGINRTLYGIGTFLEADRGYVYLLSDDESMMVNTSEWCADGVSSRMEKDNKFQVNTFTWIKNKLEQRQLIHTSNINSLTEISPAEKDFLIKRKVLSIILVPMVFGKKLKGFLGFDFIKKEMKLLEEDAALLETIADIIISSVERKRTDDSIKFEKEELSVTLRSIGDGVITTDADDIIKIINKSAEEIIGWSESELRGNSIFDVFQLIRVNTNRDSIDHQFIKKNRTSSKNKENRLNDLLEIVSKNGVKKIIYIYSADLNDPIGKLNGFVYVLRDVTEELKMEKQLFLSQKMESIGQMAAGIAHEINTPMQYINDNTLFLKDSFAAVNNYIAGITDLIKEAGNNNNYSDLISNVEKKSKEMDMDYLSSEIPVAIDQTKSGIEKVSKIVLAMKDFAHPGSKSKSLADINRGVEVTATISKNEWKYVAELELKLAEKLPLVNCVIDEINQVILNLIVNAAHAIAEKNGRTPAKKGSITVETRSISKYVEIEIRDSGTGISKENLQRIFDPFFTTKKVGKGTGQGLSIAHDIIVNKHEGKILVESEIGIGSVFKVQLPAG